ncbi:MAG: S4 domain-containing protein [Pseudomonadota bacterium]
MSTATTGQRVRLDRWLWAARFFKTRAQAKAAIEGGKVEVNNAKPKVSKEIEPGMQLNIRKGTEEWQVIVTALSQVRRGAPEAALLYEETAASIEARETSRAMRRMERAGLRIPARRPNKQQRRALDTLKRGRGHEDGRQDGSSNDVESDANT